MHPQNELVFHKEAAEAFSKPVVPFQSCASSSTFLCGFKGLLPSGGRLCITDWPGDVTTVRTVPFQELGGLTRSYTFDSVTGCTFNRSRTSEILEYRFKVSRCGNWVFHCRLPFRHSGPSFQQPRYPALIPHSLRSQGNSARMKN